MAISQVERSRMGGKAVAAEKRSFYTNRELASRAGTKGGKAVKPEQRTFKDREKAAAAGRKGGLAVQAKKREHNLLVNRLITENV